MKPKQPFDPDKLSKERRDFLEIFGNQWGTRQHSGERLTPAESQSLLDALNPFHQERPAIGNVVSIDRPR